MTITDPTRKLLWANAHNVCAAPGCHQSLTQPSQAGSGEPHVVLGQEAHIRGKGKGGPRHDPGYEDVDGYDNLILLCPTHHVEIDANGGKRFSVEDLVKLKADHVSKYRRREKATAAMRAYLAKTYASDDFTRFEQVDLQPRVDSIFVDVAVGALRGSGCESTLASIASAAPGDVDPALVESFAMAGGAQALLHPSWSGGALLVGGPGQGKTTLLQYVCQFHRARRLEKPEYTGGELALVDVKGQPRFPFRVELRNYVAWAKDNTRKPGKKGKTRRRKSVSAAPQATHPEWPHLEEYLAHEVRSRSGLAFDVKDLFALVETEPVLLALDGLDEVAAAVDREEVSKQVIQTQAGLDEVGIDVVVLVATRPGAGNAALWSSPALPQLQLLPLTQGLRLQYLQRWTAVAGLDAVARDKLQGKLLSRQHELHVKELASTPMQLAILLHLLQRKGLLPEQRTELYREYIQTFLDREQTNDKEPLLSEERTVVEQVHEHLAWRMQAAVETGSSSGSLVGSVLLRLLREYLAGRPVGLKFAESLFESFEARVMCLVERDGAYEFDVQSLREYFAAVHIADTATTRGGAGKDARLSALLTRPYWNNVTRFFVGTWTPGEVKGLRYTFMEAAGNGVMSAHPLLRSMAYLLLEDRCLQGQPDAVLEEMVDFILEGPGVFLAEDGLLDPASGPLRFSERTGRAQAVAHLKARLLTPASSVLERRAAAASLARHVTAEDAVASWWWGHFTADRGWLEIAGDLGCLDPVPPDRRRDLIAAVKAAAQEGPVSPLLSRLRGDVDELMDVLLAEMNAGAVGTIRVGEGTMLSKLVKASRGSLIELPDKPSSRRQRRVGGEVRNAWSGIVSASTATATLGPDSNVTQWGQALRQMAKVWGVDGWVLRNYVAGLPDSLELDVLAGLVADESEPLASVLTEEARRRTSAGEADFWSSSLPSANGCSVLDWIVAVLTLAHASTIIQIREPLDQAVQGLTPAELAVAAATIRMRGRRSNLMLREQLRLGQFVASVPLLLLLQPASQGATLDEVNKRLVTASRTLNAGTFADATPVAELLGKVSFEWFRGGRQGLTDVAHPDVQVTGLNPARAKEVLTDPSQWPAFVVHRAAQVLRTKIDKQEPLVAIAERDGWFT